MAPPKARTQNKNKKSRLAEAAKPIEIVPLQGQIIYEIAGTLKRMPAETRLDGFTHITGDHRKGKTSLVQALRLALDGSLPPYRSAYKTSRSLARHGHDELRVEVKTALGEARWSHTVGDKSSGADWHVSDELNELIEQKAVWKKCFPRLSDAGSLSGSEAYLMLAVQYGSLDRIPTPEGLLEPDVFDANFWETNLQAVSEELGETVSQPAKLAALTAHFETMSRSRAIAATKVENSLSELRRRMPTIRMPLAALEKRYAELVEMRSPVAQAWWENRDSEKARQLEALTSDISKIKQELESNRAHLAQLSERNVVIGKTVSDLDSQIRNLEVLAEVCAISLDQSLCQICGSEDRSEHISLRSTELVGKLEELVSKVGEIRVREQDSAESDLSRLILQVEDLTTTLFSLQERERALLSEIEASKELLKSSPDQEKLEREIADIKHDLDKAKSAETTRKIIDDKVIEYANLVREQRLASRFAEFCSRSLQEVCEKAISKAEALTQKYLADSNYKVRVLVEDGEAFWGIEDSDGFVSDEGSMSGSEIAALRIAKMLAASDGAPFRVVVVDDEELGPFVNSWEEIVSTLHRRWSEGLINQVLIVSVRKLPESLMTTAGVVILN